MKARVAGEYEDCLAGLQRHLDGGVRCRAGSPETNLNSVVRVKHVDDATRLVIVFPSNGINV
ncbi:MAG: hypothetical protein WB807_11665 [Candidatus Dormiibacterota bacterium]